MDGYGILTINKAGMSPLSIWATFAGVHYISWSPNNAEVKGGGLFSDSPYKNGRKLRARHLGNVIDNFGVGISGANFDQIALVYQDLIYRLTEGTKYWDKEYQQGAQAEPVWIKRQAPGETKPLYAYVVDWRIPGVGDPFLVAGLPEFDLTIEHTAWQTFEPGGTEILSLSNTQTWGVSSWGNETPGNGNRFLSSFDTGFQLTHLYRFDASGPSFSANLINTFPAQLFPNPVAVGDILYAGCDAATFSSVVWQLSIGLTGITTFIWEYFNGAWVDLSPNFIATLAGPGSAANLLPDGDGQAVMIWRNPTDWITTVVNAVSAFWIRLRVTGVAGPFGVKEQIDRRIYRIPARLVSSASEVKGDLDAVLRGIVASYGDQANACIIATRRASRGVHFTPYLSPVVNPPDYTIAVTAPGALVSDMTAPSGQAVRFNVAGATAETSIIEWFLLRPGEYFGEFRVFVRVRRQSGGGAGTLGLRLALTENDGSGNYFPLDQTEVFYNENATNYDMIDLGSLNLQPAGGLVSINPIGLRLSALSTAALDYRILDVVIMPIDEVAVVCKSIYTTYPNAESWTLGTSFYIDSTLPKEEGHAAIIQYPNIHIYPISPLLTAVPVYTVSRAEMIDDLTLERKREVYLFVLVWDQNTGDIKGTRNFLLPVLEKVELFTLMRGAA